MILHDFYVFCTILRLQFFRNIFFSKKKGPCGKIHTRQNIFRFFLQRKGPCGKIHTRQNIFRLFSRKKRPLRENADTAKNDLLIFSIFPGREISMYHNCSHLTTIFFIRKNTYFSDRRFLQCSDFAKSLGRKIRFGVWFYLNQSSEADIQPNLYNQTLSIIFQASQLF